MNQELIEPIALLEKELQKLEAGYAQQNCYGMAPIEIELLNQRNENSLKPFRDAIFILRNSNQDYMQTDDYKLQIQMQSYNYHVRQGFMESGYFTNPFQTR